MAGSEAVITRVMAEYDQHQADWLAGLTPEQLAQREANKATPFRPSRKISIERESRSAVLGSMFPYRY